MMIKKFSSALRKKKAALKDGTKLGGVEYTTVIIDVFVPVREEYLD